MPNNLERVQIDLSKITQYLLSEQHPDGKSKAAFFLQCGFTITEPELMIEALRQHALEHEIARQIVGEFGIKYIVEGRLTTPTERTPFIRSVWIQESVDDIPRLVTAYPIRGER